MLVSVLRLVTLASLTSISVADTALQLPLPLQSPLVQQQSQQNNDKVNVSLYVMSRCPDARLCENVFEEVFQTKGIVDKINLHVGYIGQLNKTSPLGVECKHGPLECLGNAHQLCVLKHTDVSTYSHFTDAQNYPSTFPKEIGEVSFARKSAEAVGIDWWDSGIGGCVQGKKAEKKGKNHDDGHGHGHLGKEGHKLLLENIKETLDTGVTTSCTIDITSTLVSEGKRRCVVDAGVWRGCDDGHTASDFVRVIETEWANLGSGRSV